MTDLNATAPVQPRLPVDTDAANARAPVKPQTAARAAPPSAAEVAARSEAQADRLAQANSGLNGAAKKAVDPPIPSNAVKDRGAQPPKTSDNVTGAILLAHRPDVAAREIAKRAGMSEGQVHVTMTNLKDIHDKARSIATAQETIWSKNGKPTIDGKEIQAPPDKMKAAIWRAAYERVMANSVEGRANLDKMQRAWESMSPADRAKAAPPSANPHSTYMLRLIAEGLISAW